MRNSIATSGFTLVELIVVIIVSSILAVGTSMFIMQAVRGYVDVAGRDDLATSGRIAIERMTREIRDALPNSVRVEISAGYKCLEIIPIVNAGLYASEVINHNATDRDYMLPTNSTTFHAYGNELDENNATYVAIYPVTEDGCYNATTGGEPLGGHLRRRISVSPNSVVPKVFDVVIKNISNPLSSVLFPESTYGTPPQPRFFLVDAPVSFCMENHSQGSELNRYDDYPLSDTQPTPTPSSTLNNPRLLAKNLIFNESSFEYTTDPALTRNGMVRIDLSLQREDEESEVIRFSHEVQIRNAP